MKKDPLKKQIHIILGFLVVQYLLGMFTSLFVEFPDTKNERTLWAFAQGQMLIVLHMVIGALLVVSGIVLLINAIRKKDKQWIIFASVGLFGLLIASFTGTQFISTQNDAYSYIMAVAFILAFVSYGWGLYRTKK